MLRPVESHDRLVSREYVDRVQRAADASDTHSRDFALAIRETQEDKKEHRNPADTFGEDRYESTDNSESGPIQQEDDAHRRESESGDAGAVDVTV